MATKRLIVLALLLAGCAAPLSTGQIAVPDPPCLPPGLSAAATWTPQGSVPVRFTTDAGGVAPGVVVQYVMHDQILRAYWVGDVLGAIDPDVQDAEVPIWYDPGVFTRHGVARAEATQTCQWRRYTGMET